MFTKEGLLNSISLVSALCLCAFFGSTQSQAQQIADGYYVSKENKEFLNITKDSIQFRVSNKDAFGSYWIAKSTYQYLGRNKYRIQGNEICQETSVLDSQQRKDSSITLVAFHRDSTPMPGAYFYIKNQDESKAKFEILGVSNLEGVLKIDEVALKKLLGKQLILQVKTIGFTTQQKLILRRGQDYSIRSMMPNEFPFSSNQSGIFIIKPLGNDEIEVEKVRNKKLRKLYGSSQLHKEKLTDYSDDLFFKIE